MSIWWYQAVIMGQEVVCPSLKLLESVLGQHRRLAEVRIGSHLPTEEHAKHVSDP